VDPLVATLVDRESAVRKAAAVSLHALHESTWKNCITGTLEDDFRRIASIRDSRLLKPLTAALSSAHSRDLRLAAADALGQMANGLAIDPLVSVLGDQDTAIRRAAAAALGVLGEGQWIQCVKGDADDFGRVVGISDPRRPLAARGFMDWLFAGQCRAKRMPFPLLAKIGVPMVDDIADRLLSPKAEARKLAVKTLICMCRTAQGADAVRVKQALDAAAARSGQMAAKVKHVRDNIHNPGIPVSMGGRKRWDWRSLSP
jgi:hypothetical protein